MASTKDNCSWRDSRKCRRKVSSMDERLGQSSSADASLSQAGTQHDARVRAIAADVIRRRSARLQGDGAEEQAVDQLPGLSKALRDKLTLADQIEQASIAALRV